MKKYLSGILTVCIVSALFLSGCNSTDTMQDGTYRAENKNYDSHGWKDYVVVTIKDGRYSSVEFDSVNENGAKKSEDEEYLAAYPSDTDYVKPDEYVKRLPEDLLEKQDIDQVDVIATATQSSESFKKLVEALDNSMKKGDTDTVLVENEG